jgi:hypothetical protein
MSSNLYDVDFYAWTLQQSKSLKERDFNSLDIVNLAEEIESLGKQQQQELKNRLSILIGHLLKWDYQPNQRSESWTYTIREQRLQILDLLEQNPSLKSYQDEAVAKAYPLALLLVERETPLDLRDLPNPCPYSWADILNPSFPEDLNILVD